MIKINPGLIPEINTSLQLQLAGSLSNEELCAKLSVEINRLINYDFEKLVYYLYRIDIDETKLRMLLEQKKEENTANHIANLIIERQLQKINSRKNSNPDPNIPDNEKW